MERWLDLSTAGRAARLSVVLSASGVEGQAEEDDGDEDEDEDEDEEGSGAGSARTSSCLRQTACPETWGVSMQKNCGT